MRAQRGGHRSFPTDRADCTALQVTPPGAGHSARRARPRKPAVPYLQERFFLLQVLADHRGDVIRLGIGAQLVGSSTPVLFPLVLLLQALEDTADLWAEENSRLSGTTGIGRTARHLWEAFSVRPWA